MPAHKKDPSVRARRNRASTASTLPSDARGDVPELPQRPAEYGSDGNRMDVDWHPETLSWWVDLWESPMAAEYHSSDRHGLFILAVLTDRFWRNPDQKLASEIRLQRVAFGLTPYDRRRLEWTIETADDAKDRGRQRRARQTPAPLTGDDPRSALRAVN